MTEYPEPPGYQNSPGFVKSIPHNNETYLEKCCAAYPFWADILRETDRKLEEIAPGYNISQIKDKFGGLRYYWNPPLEWRGGDRLGVIVPEFSDLNDKARMIVAEAEEKSYLALSPNGEV